MGKSDERDALGRRHGLTAEGRRERARAAANAANSVSALVRRIVRQAHALTPADVMALRELVQADDAGCYAEGIRAGARMAVERIETALSGAKAIMEGKR